MAKTVKISTSPNSVQKPRVDFRSRNFNDSVWQKGYDVIIESAIKCPCKSKNNDHLITCQNCGGSGWVMVNSVKDRAVLTSINVNTEYKEWSELMIGTVQVTVMNRSFLFYMDRITVEDSEVIHSEVLYPKIFGDKYFTYTIYNIDGIVEIFRFVAEDEPLELLTLNEDYTFERNKILITVTNVADVAALRAVTEYKDKQKATITANGYLYEFSNESTDTDDSSSIIKPDDILQEDPGRWLRVSDYTISVRYKHKLQYSVLDVPHANRNSYKKNNLGREELQKLPVHAIARLTHYVVDSQNFAGDKIFDNSYQTL